MRFFSNDSRDSADDQSRTDEQADRAQAPAAVPLQRPSSPWAASPGTSPEPSPGRGTTVERDREDDPDYADAELTDQEAGERPPFHEPGPQPTAFGAGTVGGAVAASATANPLNDDVSDLPDTTDRRTDAAHGVADDRMVQPGDGAVSDSTTGSPGDRPGDSPGDTPIAVPFTGTGDAPVTGTGPRHDDEDAGRRVDHRTDDGDPVDLSLKDSGTFDDPVVADDRTATGNKDDDPIDLPLEDRGTFEDPVVVDGGGEAGTLADRSPDTDVDATPAAAGPAAAESPAVGSAAVGSAAVGSAAVGSAAVPGSGGGVRGDQLPGGIAAPEVGPLFADTDAHSFRDRWRDVQLRFVDDPKGATDDAASLVDDAVDALAASLRRQKEQLAGGVGSEAGSDTEQLRVRLRGYRDFLDRMLDL